MSDRILQSYLRAARSKSLWVDLDSGEVISDQELRERIQSGDLHPSQVSSKHAKLPVFGDVERAIRVHLPELAALVEFGPKSPLSCHAGVKGFINKAASCFLDSVLMALFAFKGSPFYANLIEHPILGGDGVCSEDPGKNAKILISLQKELKKDVDHILEGGAKVCGMLRAVLGRDCRLKGEENLSVGTHDVSETYSRLMRAFAYNPIQVEFRRSRTGQHASDPRTEIRDTIMLDPLRVSDPDLTRISWPGPWGPTKMQVENEEGSPDVVSSSMSILRADAIVVHLDRRKSLDLPATVLNDRSVKVDETMLVKFKNGSQREYILSAVVYSPKDGHFAAYLKCGVNWLVYDDLNVGKPFEENRAETKLVLKQINTRGVLFVYY